MGWTYGVMGETQITASRAKINLVKGFDLRSLLLLGPKKPLRSRVIPIGKPMILQWLSDAKHYRRLNLA